MGQSCTLLAELFRRPGCEHRSLANGGVEMTEVALKPEPAPQLVQTKVIPAAIPDRRQLEVENIAHREMLKFLGSVRLFQRLPRDQHPILANAVTRGFFVAGQVVIRQGEMGSELYVITSGEADVFIESPKPGGRATERRLVDTMSTGDYFGETALISDAPRTATIVAKSALETLKLTRDKFEELGLGAKFKWPRRKAVGGGLQTQASGRPSNAQTAKTPADRHFIGCALRGNFHLQAMIQFDSRKVEELIDAAWLIDVVAGEDIITEGDLKADAFYIVREGAFSAFSQGDPTSPPTSPRNNYERSARSGPSMARSIGVGGSFGELALLYLAPRSATVRAEMRSQVWAIDRGNFKRILMKASEEIVEQNAKILDLVKILNPLCHDDKAEVAKALVEMYFTAGETIFQQNEPGNTFYIVLEGEVSLVVNGNEKRRLGPHDYFGEQALINGYTRDATAVVVSKAAKLAALDRDTFDMLVGPLVDASNNAGRKTLYRRPNLTSMDVHRDRVGSINDLRRLALLGCGGFGTVELVEHTNTGATYALKMLSKGFIVKRKMQKSVLSEKDVLLATDSPFIIKLYETYNSGDKLYFLMEVALGGELFTTYRVRGLHGDAVHAKYYAAGVTYAFEHLHIRRIVYRDLKPENLLLDAFGRLKLTDMGLAKFVVGQTFTSCGTPDYFAPEVVTSRGHNMAVDWWTLGILIFELLAGHAPFEARDMMTIYSNIVAGIENVSMPPACQGAAKTLIYGLLQRNPSERLPMRQGGTDNIRKCSWYAGFDWEAFAAGRMEAPFKPVVRSLKDAGNFCVSVSDAPKALPYHDPGDGWDDDFATSV